MSTPIIIYGALGKMGREIAKVAFDDPDTFVAGCVERVGHPEIGKDIGEILGIGHRGVAISESLTQCSADGAVVIHFAAAETVASALKDLSPVNAGVVVGTTGISTDGEEAISFCSTSFPVVYSSNMSRGVNLLFRLTQIVAEALQNDFDIEIVEAHHRLKKDAPSGTAKTLGEIIAAAMQGTYGDLVKNGRSGIGGERPRKEIGMHAVRGGDIVGDHTVLFAGIGERVELRHMAHSRSTFARGAVAAAKWVAGKDPGLYTMRDVLGI